jgi:uncharacterized protein (DUF433 family)
MAATVLHIDEIVSDPKIRGGRPVIKGTGLRVIDIAAYHIGPDKQSPEQLAANFRLTLGQIHASLAYYYLHKEELEADMRAEHERAERLADELEAQGRLTRVEVDEPEPKLP